jgi:hypothetical protein
MNLMVRVQEAGMKRAPNVVSQVASMAVTLITGYGLTTSEAEVDIREAFEMTVRDLSLSMSVIDGHRILDVAVGVV